MLIILYRKARLHVPFIFLIFFSARLVAQDVTFSEFVIEDGLTSVNAILIDDFGYKWFGGTHGLYRHDGYGFAIFKHSPDETYSLSSNDVNTLFEDGRNNIWIGLSKNGANIFERETERLVRLTNIPILAASTVTDFEEDAGGNIWIGTLKNGLFVLNPDYSLKEHFTHNILNSSSLSNNDVFDLLIDSEENFWVVTNSGALDLYNPEDGSFVHYYFQSKQLFGIRSGQKLLEAEPGKIWVGTEGQGIFEFSIASHSFEQLNPQGNGSVNTSIITGFGKDSKKNIWISTDGGGLYCRQSSDKTFTHYGYDEQEEFGISNNAFYSLVIDRSSRIWLGMGNGKVNVSNSHPFHFIRAGRGISFNVVVDLLVDQNANIWVATGGGGIDVIESKSLRQLFSFNAEKEPLLQTDIILTLFEDHNQNIWAGTFLGGVNLWSSSGEILDHYAHSEVGNSLSNDHIFDITEDAEGKIWMATQGGGVDCFDPRAQVFRNYSVENKSGLVSNRLQSLWADSQNRIWAGHFFGGVQIFDRISSQFVSVELPSDLHRSIAKYPVHAIYEDSRSNILICTGGMGLVVLDSTFTQYTIYNQQSGLPSNAVYGVIQFEDYYWVSTNMGLVRISPDSQEILTLDRNDGLITNDFEAGAIAANRQTGTLYFGSKEGVVYFKPNEIARYGEAPQIVFSSLVVLNRPIVPGDSLAGEVILERSLLFSERIQLPYSQNSFSVSFACPGFKKPQKLLYRYQLKGWEDRWLIAEPNRRFANYTNVDFGEYELAVQASTDGGKSWIAERAVQVIISAPFYHSKLAYLLYVLLIGGVVSGIYHFIRGRVALRNQLEIEKISRTKDNEVNREKINFFTNISHEIRTPLTLMLGHLERLFNLEGIEQVVRRELDIMSRNGNRLLMLTNQLLDFRKIEMGQMKLKVSHQDVVHIIQEILLPFRELAMQKNISLQFKNELSSPYAYFDASKIEIILYNLLSNALKFTTPNGQIEIMLREKEGSLALSVSDSGPGIKRDNLEKIFEPFFQGEAGSRRGMQGTGIGLSLVKELVELHHGIVSVMSKENSGAIFQVLLPSNAAAYSASEVVELKERGIDLHEAETSRIPFESEEAAITLLLVEDNEEILSFLSDGFAEEYQVLTASDGKSGLERAIEVIPDVIISDVMMPEMDGMEMCRHLKEDIRTNHIPIILLTARTGFIHEHSGLDTGADDYITKPFRFDLLRIRINNLIENRKRVHKKIRRDFLLEPKRVDVNDPNEQFVVDAMNLIEENISNEEYTVKELAKDMGMSHSVLYRKVKALTNMTVSAFVKSVRLKKAAQLLKTGAGSISDVAYQTGFSNPKYFSTCFRQEFGQTPSEVMRNHQQRPTDQNTSLLDQFDPR